MSRKKIILALTLILVASYVVAVPYVTVYQMRSAANNGDSEALSEHIDFASVRQNLKDQMNIAFAKKMAADENMKDNPFAALGSAFAGVIVDKMVDVYITPAGMAELMSGEKSDSNDKLLSAQNSDKTETDQAEKEPFSNASMFYTSINKFIVHIKEDDGDEAKLIMRRKGLFDWKLTEIIVPFDKIS